MSHYRLKTKYNSEGSYGSIDEKTLYVHHNLSCDYVTFFDENGEVIMTIPDTIDNNLLDAVNRLYKPFTNGKKFVDNVERMTDEDIEKTRKI